MGDTAHDTGQANSVFSGLEYQFPQKCFTTLASQYWVFIFYDAVCIQVWKHECGNPDNIPTCRVGCYLISAKD